MAETAMRVISADADYVRKDVFEAHMQRIDQRFDAMQLLMEKTLAEIKADNEKLRVDLKSEMRESIAKLDNKIESSNAQLRNEMKESNAQLRNEMKESNAQLRNEMKESNAQLRSEMKESNAQLHSEIRVLDARINNLSTRIDGVQTTVYWGFALMGLFVAILGFFITFAPSIWGMLRKRRKASLSRREMEDILSKYLGQIPDMQGKPQSV